MKKINLAALTTLFFAIPAYSLDKSDIARLQAQEQLKQADDEFQRIFHSSNYYRAGESGSQLKFRLIHESIKKFEKLINTPQTPADVKAEALHALASNLQHQQLINMRYNLEGKLVSVPDTFKQVVDNPAAAPQIRYDSMMRLAKLLENPNYYEQVINGNDAPLTMKREALDNLITQESEIFAKNYKNTRGTLALEKIKQVVNKAVVLPLTSEEKAHLLEETAVAVGYFFGRTKPIDVMHYQVELLNQALSQQPLPQKLQESIQYYKNDLEQHLINKENPGNPLKRLADDLD